jgi:hypothetical protein
VVASCGSGLTLAYGTTFDDAVGGYVVNGIKLSDIPVDCLSESLSATFEDAAHNAVGAEVDVTLPDSGATESIAVDPSSNRIDATRVSSASLVVSWPLAPRQPSRHVCGRAVLLDRLVEEAADRGRGVGSDEAGDGIAVPEDGDRGDALDAVLGGEHLLGVDVDLDERDLVLALGDLALDRRAEHAARAAPGGPDRAAVLLAACQRDLRGKQEEPKGRGGHREHEGNDSVESRSGRGLCRGVCRQRRQLAAFRSPMGCAAGSTLKG